MHPKVLFGYRSMIDLDKVDAIYYNIQKSLEPNA